MEPLCNVPPCDIFTWSIYSIKSPTSWNHKYILFTPSIHHPVSCNKTHYYYGPSGSDTSVWCAARLWWGHGHLEPWRWRRVEGLVRGWLVVTSADNGPTTCHHQLGSSSSHNKHGTQSTFIRKHFWINMAFDLRKKGAVKRIVFWSDRLKMTEICNDTIKVLYIKIIGEI